MVTIPGEPLPKQRPRFARGRAYKADSEAQKLVAWHVAKVFGNRRFEGNVELRAYFYRSTRRSVDLDNLLKLAMDACNGVAWTDDRQVKSLAASLRYDPSEPRTELVIEEISKEALSW